MLAPTRAIWTAKTNRPMQHPKIMSTVPTIPRILPMFVTNGVVEEIHIFSTLMRTGDNVQVIVPNGQIIGGTIANFSSKETRRIDLVVGCGYGDNLRTVREFLDSLLRADDRILDDPEPVVAVSELGASSVDFVVRPWVKNADYWAVRWDLTEKIKLGFDEQGFSIPYPQQDVHVHGIPA